MLKTIMLKSLGLSSLWILVWWFIQLDSLNAYYNERLGLASNGLSGFGALVWTPIGWTVSYFLLRDIQDRINVSTGIRKSTLMLLGVCVSIASLPWALIILLFT